jgi:hypothetical protein
VVAVEARAVSASAAIGPGAAEKQKQKGKKDQQQQNQQQKEQKQSSKDQQDPPQQQKAVVRFVSLGLSPFHQLKDGEMKHSKSVAKWLNRAFEHGNPFYPFKTIAASKAKYGAGLHDGVYKDTTVTYRTTYLCHTHGPQAAVTLYDLGAFVGFYYYPIPAMLTMLKAKRQHDKERAAMERNGSRQLSAISEYERSEISEVDSSICAADSGKLGSQAGKPSSQVLDESDDVSSSSSGPAPVKAKLVVPRAKGAPECGKELTSDKCYSHLMEPKVIKAGSYSTATAPQVVEIV